MQWTHGWWCLQLVLSKPWVIYSECKWPWWSKKSSNKDVFLRRNKRNIPLSWPATVAVYLVSVWWHTTQLRSTLPEPGGPEAHGWPAEQRQTMPALAKEAQTPGWKRSNLFWWAKISNIIFFQDEKQKNRLIPFSPLFFLVRSMWSLSWILTCLSFGWSLIKGCFKSCSVEGRCM